RAGRQRHVRVVCDALDLPGGRPGGEVDFVADEADGHWGAHCRAVTAEAGQQRDLGSAQRCERARGRGDRITHGWSFSITRITRPPRGREVWRAPALQDSSLLAAVPTNMVGSCQ